MAADPTPPEPGPARPAPPAGALALGAALGGGAWWCEQVFAVAGAWVPSAPEAGVRAHLAELSRVAGDHALALRRHLPRPTGVDPETWVRGRDGASDVVVALGAPTDSLDRLAGLHRAVLPRLLVAWSAHRDAAAASPADRGVARTLGHALADLDDLHREGEGLIQALVGTDGDRARAAAAVAGELDAALAVAGGLLPDAPAAMPVDPI